MHFFPIHYKEYTSHKSKKYLIMLHGWGTNSEIFDQYVAEYRDIYNIIVFDLYGFGQSIVPEPFFDTYEYALQLYLFLKSYNISIVSVLSHSFGGRIAMILAALFDIQLDRIILAGAAGLRPKRSLVYYWKIILYKIKKRIFRITNNNSGSEDYRNGTDALRCVLVKVVNQHLDYLLSHIHSSVLLVWGRLDDATPMYMYNKLLHNIKDCIGVVVDDAAHFCIYTHMYLCNNKIREFVRDV